MSIAIRMLITGTSTLSERFCNVQIILWSVLNCLHLHVKVAWLPWWYTIVWGHFIVCQSKSHVCYYIIVWSPVWLIAKRLKCTMTHLLYRTRDRITGFTSKLIIHESSVVNQFLINFTIVANWYCGVLSQTAGRKNTQLYAKGFNMPTMLYFHKHLHNLAAGIV